MRGTAPTYQQYANAYNTVKSLGAAALACNALLIPTGFEHLQFLIQSFPLPITTGREAVAVDYAMGLEGHRTGVPKTKFDGSISMIETETGMIYEFSKQLTKMGGMLDKCKVVFGVSDGKSGNGTFVREIHDVIITFDNGGEIDAASREQILIMQANISYMFFGDDVALGDVGKFNDARTGVANAFASGNGGASALTNLVGAALGAYGNARANTGLSTTGFGGGSFNIGG